MAYGLFPSPPLCSTSSGKGLALAMGGNHTHHHLCLGLPSVLLPFLLRAAHPATRKEGQSLLGYTLAPRRLEVASFPF